MEKTNKMILLCGLPASGKSTYTKKLQEKGYKIHSSDAIREELYGDASIVEDHAKVFDILHSRLIKDLVDGLDVVFDATNISYKKRMGFLQKVKKVKLNVECIAVYFATPYEDCLKNNNKRERLVPEHVIKNMYLNLYIPQLYEGFDKVEIVHNYNRDDYDLNGLFNGEDGLNKIDQENKFHTLTVGHHCLKCTSLLDNEGNDNFLLTMAGLFHDIGKKLTKKFENGKREITEEAHYYQHHLVSAQMLIPYLGRRCFVDEEILQVCNYVQWHMQPFSMESEKSKKKYIKLWGGKTYDEIIRLHEADVLAK